MDDWVGQEAIVEFDEALAKAIDSSGIENNHIDHFTE